eukprot:gb/GECH01014269.1/.p1 GENE.gb/GECH01014269.1/~~gb/GECH01014269.1/.p1  ORF type:complete len:390 (+),score=97.69 gb/GECH01014269.1/:1-1170(+)
MSYDTDEEELDAPQRSRARIAVGPHIHTIEFDDSQERDDIATALFEKHLRQKRKEQEQAAAAELLGWQQRSSSSSLLSDGGHGRDPNQKKGVREQNLSSHNVPDKDGDEGEGNVGDTHSVDSLLSVDSDLLMSPTEEGGAEDEQEGPSQGVDVFAGYEPDDAHELHAPLVRVTELDPLHAWRVQVTVRRRYPVKAWSNHAGSGHLWKLDLRDALVPEEEADDHDHIHAVIWNEAIDLMRDMFEEGGVYEVWGARLKESNQRFTWIPHRFEMDITPATSVSLIHPPPPSSSSSKTNRRHKKQPSSTTMTERQGKRYRPSENVEQGEHGFSQRMDAVERRVTADSVALSDRVFGASTSPSKRRRIASEESPLSMRTQQEDDDREDLLEQIE